MRDNNESWCVILTVASCHYSGPSSTAPKGRINGEGCIKKGILGKNLCQMLNVEKMATFKTGRSQKNQH